MAWGKHMLIMNEFDSSAIKSSLALLIGRLSSSEQPNFNERLAQYVEWEFEDYEG